MDTPDIWDALDRRPFDTRSGLVDFVVFQERLTSLLRACDSVDEGIQRYLHDVRRSVAANPDDGFADSERQFVLDQLSWSEEWIPTFTYGGLLIAVFSLFEQLLAGLCELTASRTSHQPTTKAGSRRSNTESMLQFLVQETECDLDARDDWTTFHRLRLLRNRFAHSLAEDVSAELRESLRSTLGESEVPLVGSETVRRAISTVGALAQELDTAF
jgi:hypothetical protein